MWAALHQQLGTGREVSGQDFCCLLLCPFWQLVKGCSVRRVEMWDCEGQEDEMCWWCLWRWS